MSKKFRIWVGITIVIGAVVAATTVHAFAGDSKPYAIWAPNVTTVAAMRNLPAVAGPSSSLAWVVQRSASATGGDAATALATLRLLASNLGDTNSDLYAYAPSGDALCVVLWQRQGGCPTAGSQPLAPGIEVILSPGGPGYVNQGPDVKPAVAGVVTDSVRSVTLVEGGVSTPLRIKNNAFFSELAEAADAAFSVALQISYSDGSTKSITLHQLAPQSHP